MSYSSPVPPLLVALSAAIRIFDSTVRKVVTRMKWAE